MLGVLPGSVVQRAGCEVKTFRQIAVFPLDVLLMGVVVLAIAVDLLGGFVGHLCQVIGGEE